MVNKFIVSRHLVVLLILFCFVWAGESSAQVSKGSISGNVVDPQNAAITVADVRVRNSETNQEFSTTTDSEGNFRINLLPIGNYHLEISKEGFRKLLVDQVSVSVGTDQGLGPLRLEIGSVKTTIEVTSSTGLIQSTEAQISSSFGKDALNSYPLLAVNQGLDILALSVPGVVNSRDLGFSNANGAEFAVNGLRGRSNDQQIDGQNNNDNSSTGPGLTVSDPEFVAEYQITTSNFGPEYGRNSGSVVNVVTKSGTNGLHGSLYGNESNWRFESLSTNQKIFEGLTQFPNFNDAFVGGTLGGPVLKNKLFFFAGVDSEFINRSTVFGTGSLTPTLAGIATLRSCFPNSSSVQTLTNYGPYAIAAGNPIPQGDVTLSDYAGCPGVALAGIQRTLPTNSRQHNFVVRLDYQTDKNHFYGRYIYNYINISNSDGNPYAGFPADTPSLSQEYGFSWARIISNRMANEFRASYGRFGGQIGGNAYGNTVPLTGQLADAFTFISFRDPSLLPIGVPTGLPQGRVINTYQLQDNWTYLLGRHSLKAGVNFTYQRSPNIFLPNYSGAYQFRDYGALALNTPSRIRIASGTPDLDFREKDTFLYLGDDFKIKPNLTLNLGLTWSYFGQPANLFHALTTKLQTGPDPLWDPSLPLSVTTYPSLPAPKNSWGPSFGFAWSPRKGLFSSGSGKTVFRGGYRLAYDPPYYNIYINISTAAPSVLLSTLTGADAAANPLPLVPTGANVRASLAPFLQTGIFDPRTFTQTSISPNFGPDRVQQWSFGVQQQIVPNAVFEVRYVGNHGQNLFQTINGNPFILGLANVYPNQIPAGLLPCPASQAAIPEDAGRVSCDTGAVVRERTNTGYSDYHGLQTEIRFTHLWHQLTLRSAYTFSKTTDNVSEIYASGGAGNTVFASQNQVNYTSQEHGLSGLDFPQNWVLSVSEELPFYRSQRSWIGHALGGWAVSAVYSLSSGQPYTPVQGGLNCGSGGGACGGIPDSLNPYDPGFNNAYVGSDGALRPFMGSPAAPAQSVGIFANDICSVDVSGNLCGSSAITPTTLLSLNQFNNGFTGTTTDSLGNTVPDPAHPAIVVLPNQVRFIANTATANSVFGTPFGNAGRNTLRDCRTNILNLSISKTTFVSEKIQVRFHADFLNALNHPNYGSIDPFLDDAGLVSEGTGFANPRVQGGGHRFIGFGLKVIF